MPARFDLHVHTDASPDSRLRLRDLPHRVESRGLRGVAVTDHNTVANLPKLAALRDRHPEYLWIPGLEVSAREGHALLYGVESAPPPRPALPALADWARDHNCVLVLAHPLRWIHGAGAAAAREMRADGLEALNGRTAATANARCELLAARRGVAVTGGSDAHEPATVGRAYTIFPDDPETVEDLLEMIRHRRTDAGGRSLSAAGRIALAARNGLLRAARGFRPV